MDCIKFDMNIKNLQYKGNIFNYSSNKKLQYGIHSDTHTHTYIYIRQSYFWCNYQLTKLELIRLTKTPFCEYLESSSYFNFNL